MTGEYPRAADGNGSRPSCGCCEPIDELCARVEALEQTLTALARTTHKMLTHLETKLDKVLTHLGVGL